MRRFFPYHGSKQNLARLYGPPRFATVVEPFAGSAGYSAHWNSRKTILVEKNPVIAGIWRWLIAAAPEEIMALPAEATGLAELAHLPEGARNLVGMWFSRGSTGPRQNIARANLADKLAGSGDVWGEKVRLRLAEQVESIREWEIIEGDYCDAPDIEAHWHIDPPYQYKGGNYKFNGSGIDFAALGDWCRNRRGGGEVCEAAGADWLPFEALCTRENQTHKDYTEVVHYLDGRVGGLLAPRPDQP